MSAHHSAYSIEIVKLKLGNHAFEFQIDDDFFAGFDEPVVAKAQVTAKISLDKGPTLLNLFFHLSGHLTLPCDRCGEAYTHPLDAEHRVIFSTDTAFEGADDEDIVFIPREAQHLDLRQELYDLVSLGAPLRRVPPDCPKPSCPPEVLHYITGLDDEAEQPQNIDPRWAGLSKLKSDDN